MEAEMLINLGQTQFERERAGLEIEGDQIA